MMDHNNRHEVSKKPGYFPRFSLIVFLVTLAFLGFSSTAKAADPGDGILHLGTTGYVSRSDASVSDLDYTKDFSVESTVDIPAYSTSGVWTGLLSKTLNSFDASSGFALTMGHSQFDTFGQNMYAKIGDGTHGGADIMSPSAYQGITHVVMTWNATSKLLTLYVNGIAVGNTTETGLVSASIQNSDSLQIGTSLGGDGTTLGRDILFARLWNNELSASDITAIYNNFTNTGQHIVPMGISTTTLVSEWLMKDKSDASGNAGTTYVKDTVGSNHLQLLGGAVIYLGTGALAGSYPTDAATGVSPAVTLTAVGGISTLGSSVVYPLQYEFQIDESSAFNTSALKDSGWIRDFASWKPVLKPDATYYWHVRVKDSAASPVISSYTVSYTFSTRAAEDWYVRKNVYTGNIVGDYTPETVPGTYGSENGSSYANAWNGIRNIVWGENGVSAGDNLYVCGTHILTTSVGGYYPQYGLEYIRESGYSDAYPITIRMDCPDDAGALWGVWLDNRSAVTWSGPDANGVYSSTNLTSGGVAEMIGGNLTWLHSTTSMTWSGYTGTINSGEATTYVKMSDGSNPTGKIYSAGWGFRFNLGRSSYVKFYSANLFGTGPEAEFITTTLSTIPPPQHITIDTSNIRYTQVCVGLFKGYDYWTVKNSDLSYCANGIYAFFTNSLGADNFGANYLTVDNNKIHDIGGDDFYDPDEHGIGIQGGQGDVIQNNEIYNTGGTAIEFWTGWQPMKDMIVRHNFIHDIYVKASTASCGIVVSGDNDESVEGLRTGYYIYGNIILNTGIGATDPSWEGCGFGASNKDQQYIFNNSFYGTIRGMSANVVGTGEVRSQFFNNLDAVVSSLLVQIQSPTTMANLLLDYNIYYSVANFADSFSVYPETTRDAHSIATVSSLRLTSESPAVASDFYPLWNSPVIDAGIATSSLVSDYAGNPIYGRPDMGAYEYQPPFTLGTSLLDPTGNIRIYGDGKYRYVSATSTTMHASFSVAPAEGSWTYGSADIRPEWLNVTNFTWNTSDNYSKRWIASSTMATTTVYTIGDLLPDTQYDFAIDGLGTSTSVANGSGVATFTYSGGYSNHVFTVTQSSGAPSSVPTLTTSVASSVSTSTLTLNANISSIGSASVTQHGFAYGTDSSLSTVIATTTLGSGSAGDFSQAVSSLSPATSYYFRAYAVNSVGTSTGAILSTTTIPIVGPIVTTSVATDLSTSTATLNANTSSLGGNPVTQHGFAYGTNPGLSTVISTTTLNGQSSTGTFNQNLTGLTPNSTYYFRAYATNSASTTVGSILSFATTDTTVPAVSMTSPSAGSTISGSSISLAATASDDVSVSGVQFKLDGTSNINAETIGPYSTTWDSTAITTLSSHTLYAVVRDAAGNRATSTVSITVDNVKPVMVSAVHNSDSQIIMTLSKLSNAATITKSNDGGFTVTKTGDPATTYAVSAVAPGSDNTKAVLTVADLSASGGAGVVVAYSHSGNGTVADTLGNLLATDSTGITIPPWNTVAPTVSSISSTVLNGSYKQGAPIDINLTFSKAVSSTGSVTVTLNTGGTCSFTVSDSSTASCTYTVGTGQNANPLNVTSISGTITSTDSNPMTSFVPALNLSANKTIIVDTTVPTITFTVPSNGGTVSGALVTLTAANSDAGSGIAGVQFKVDGANAGSEGSTNPYSISWNSTLVSNASHTLDAVAWDNAGNRATSTVTVIVDNINPDTTPPTVSGGSPSGTLAVDTASATLQVTTDESANCKYSTIANTAYASVSSDMTTSNGTTHTAVLNGLTNGTGYTYYVRCKDASNNPNMSDYPISFSVANPSQATNPVVFYGGGGGGGGGSPAYIYPVATTTASTSLANMSGASLCQVTMYPILTKPLFQGMTGNDVVLLKQILFFEKFLSTTTPSSLYDASTTLAVYSFQRKYATSSVNTAESGTVGQKTILAVNQLISQGKYPSLAICLTKNISTAKASSYVFTRNLTLGSTGTDVKNLQQFLNVQGFNVAKSGNGSPGHETAYFGQATKAALIKFQEYYAEDILVPNGLTKGTGFFGASTRGKINSMK